MKPLRNRNPFGGVEAREYHHRGTECFRTVERHRFLQYLHPAEPLGDMLLGCLLFCRTRSWSGDYHYRKNPPFLTLTLIHSGGMTFRTAEFAGIAEPGDAVLFHPGTEYEFMTEEACERSAVLLTGPLLPALLAASGLAGRTVVALGNASAAEQAMTAAGAALRESSLHAGKRRISEASFALLQAVACPEPPDATPELLELVLAEMERNCQLPLSVEALARKHGITASGLTRMFLRHRGVTPYRHLRNLRMNLAAKLLEAHTFTVKEVAARVGYEHPLNFSTEFRKCFGVSPRAYRNGSTSLSSTT